MLKLISKTEETLPVTTTLTLPWEKRTKSRLRVVLDNDEAAGIFLPPGTILRHGEVLTDGHGTYVGIQAAAEPITIAHAKTPLLLARICYHLGNRHATLQISEQEVKYLHDHVLDDMVKKLGGSVTSGLAPFEPEYGAYGGHPGHHHA